MFDIDFLFRQTGENVKNEYAVIRVIKKEFLVTRSTQN